MLAYEATSDGFKVTDGADRGVAVRAPDWRPGGDARELPHRVDTATTGTASSLALPATPVALVETVTGDRIGLDSGESTLGDGSYLLATDAAVTTFLRFDGPATVAHRGRDPGVALTFPDQRNLTLGFRADARAERTVTVPPTPTGVAAAIEAFGGAHGTTTAARSAPAMRGRPPALAFDPACDATTVTTDGPDTGVEIVAPPDLGALFAVAPLAYYCSASVRVATIATPRVHAPDVGIERELTDPARDAAALLERAFWLDTLVRLAAADRPTAETALLDRLGIDAAATFDRPIDARLCTYLDVAYDGVRDTLPEWPLSMYVEPTVEHARTLPAVLDRLGHIYPPESTELDGRELLKRSLDAFYRDDSSGASAAVDVVQPRLRDGRAHGWLADGTPIDAFKTTPEAYANDRTRSTGDAPLSVAVVLNDAAMASEHARVAEIYRERAVDVPMDVTLEEDLTRAELAAVFERHHDFVHYIGHCEVDGLRCTDGALAATDLDTSNARTFFLNACGSYHEGLALVERGSVAGAVTFRKVLDEQAARVGTAFARLLVAGFGIGRALRLARRRIAMGKEYAVVGDGTHVVTGREHAPSVTLDVEHVGDDRVSVTYDERSPRARTGARIDSRPRWASSDVSTGTRRR
ncbi:hypothetical protein [Halarchaeum salinum]|uniref:CHAT domain-containing protein n=1 Tax=Halarchaeum salinum TaxID=489912 RepID=A0AAV3S7J4_9EURY